MSYQSSILEVLLVEFVFSFCCPFASSLASSSSVKALLMPIAIKALMLSIIYCVYVVHADASISCFLLMFVALVVVVIVVVVVSSSPLSMVAMQCYYEHFSTKMTWYGVEDRRKSQN